MSDFTRLRIRKNRRPRRNCDDCGRPITPGTNYAYWVGVFDGRFGCCGYCLTCNEKYRNPSVPTLAMIEDRKLAACYRECGE